LRRKLQRDQGEAIATSIPGLQDKVAAVLGALSQLEEVSSQIAEVNRQLQGVDKIVAGVNEARRLLADVIEAQHGYEHELARARYTSRKLAYLSLVNPEILLSWDVMVRTEESLRGEYDGLCVVVGFFGRCRKTG